MKLEMKLEWTVHLEEPFDLFPVDQIARNFENDEFLHHILSEGCPISDVKCTVTRTGYKMSEVVND